MLGFFVVDVPRMQVSQAALSNRAPLWAYEVCIPASGGWTCLLQHPQKLALAEMDLHKNGYGRERCDLSKRKNRLHS